jgi:hypothetical protein
MRRLGTWLVLILLGMSAYAAQVGTVQIFPFAASLPYTNGQCIVFSSSGGYFTNGTCGGTGGTFTNPIFAGTASGPLVGLTVVSAQQVSGVYYADTFPGADMSIQIANCLVALGAVSLNSGKCIWNAKGPTAAAATFSVNPWTYAGAEGTNYPYTGEVDIVGGVYTIDVKVPIVLGNGWRLEGVGSAQRGGATQLVADATAFPAAYSTGTCTPGTVGWQEVISCSGTAFTASMVGCQIMLAPAQPTGTSRTFGYIAVVNSTTNITLGFGINGSGGAAPSSSAIQVQCPLVSEGDGNVGTFPYEFGMDISHFGLNCNNVAGCIALANWFGEEGTTASDLNIVNYDNIGMDVETNYAQQAGPFTNIGFNPGTSCNASTISLVLRAGVVAMKQFQNFTLGDSTCSTKINEAVDVAGTVVIHDLHIETAVTGVAIGHNTSCRYFCASTTGAINGGLIDGINVASTGTTVVALTGANSGVTIHNILMSGGTGWTNSLTDAANGCTDTGGWLGTYEISEGGTIQNSSSTVCPAVPRIAGLVAAGSAIQVYSTMNFSATPGFSAGINVSAGSTVATPSVQIAGSSSGVVSILPQAAAGTFNFNLPVTAGNAGQVLTSGGGSGSPMTWGSGQPEQTISYQPGLMTTIITTKSAFTKFVNASTVDNIIASTNSLTCATNPTITLYECGTSTTCASPTTIGGVQVTASGTATPATISSSAITAGDYVAWAVSAGTCTSLDIAATAQVHSN